MVMRSIKPYICFNILNMVQCLYFHSIMAYGLLFWGNSSHNIKVFRKQKYIICIMMGCKKRESCRHLLGN